MTPDDLVNHEVLAETERYCPNCDPPGTYPIKCPPGQCSCGHMLCVVTPWTGERTMIPENRR